MKEIAHLPGRKDLEVRIFFPDQIPFKINLSVIE
jgi:hypothetical protein